MSVGSIRLSLRCCTVNSIIICAVKNLYDVLLRWPGISRLLLVQFCLTLMNGSTKEAWGRGTGLPIFGLPPTPTPSLSSTDSLIIRKLCVNRINPQCSHCCPVLLCYRIFQIQTYVKTGSPENCIALSLRLLTYFAGATLEKVPVRWQISLWLPLASLGKSGGRHFCRDLVLLRLWVTAIDDSVLSDV